MSPLPLRLDLPALRFIVHAVHGDMQRLTSVLLFHVVFTPPGLFPFRPATVLWVRFRSLKRFLRSLRSFRGGRKQNRGHARSRDGPWGLGPVAGTTVNLE